MWNMAGDAALDPHGLMFKYERASLIRVAGKANRVLGSRGPQLTRQEAPVLVMTVGALHQAFVNAMMKRLAELRADVLVAPITKCRLTVYQKELRLFGMMRRMAVDASNVIAAVRRAQEIAVFFAIL